MQSFHINKNKLYSSLLLLAVLFTFSSTLSAQAPSPYSRYGLGSLQPTHFGAQLGMAGLSAAYSSPTTINYNNPASYSRLLLTTFDIGANYEGLSFQSPSGDTTYNTGNGALTNLCLGFPIKTNKWGMSIGYMPFSVVNYSFLAERTDPDIGYYQELYNGDGALQKVYAGLAYQWKGLSVGANANVVFGQLDYSKVVFFPDSAQAFSTRNTTSLNVRDFTFNFGIQYRTKLNLENRANDPDKGDIYMTVGAYGSPSQKVFTEVSEIWERFNFVNGNLLVKDTLNDITPVESQSSLPLYLSAGIAFDQPGKWTLGMDYKMGQWSGFDTPLSNDELSDSWRLLVGGSITPDADNAESFFARTQYRAGFYFGQTELSFDGSQLSDFGMTFGLGLPIPRSLSKANLAFEYSTRGPSGDQLIRENYYKVSLGFTLNDKWFVKRKFD